MKKPILLFFLVVLMFVMPRKLFAQPNQHIDTIYSGEYTKPLIWPGSPGCEHHWVAGNTSAGLPDYGIGNIPSFQARNVGQLSAFVYIESDMVASLPARAYIPSQLGNKVAVVDITDNNKIIKTIDVGKKPYAVAINHNGVRVYVSNYTDGTISVIDAVANKVITTITVGKNPAAIAISPDDGAVYVANSGDGTVSIIDAGTNKVTGALTTATNPVDVATSKDGSLLYVAYGNSTPLSVFKLQSHSIIPGLLPGNVRNMVLSPDGITLYTLNPGTNQVYSTINTATNTSAPYNIGAGNNGITITPDGGTLYLTGPANQLTSINTSNNTLNKQITVGDNPNGVAVAPGGLVYVINGDSNDVSVIDAMAGNVVSTFKTGDLQLFAHGNFIRGSTCSSADSVFTSTLTTDSLTYLAHYVFYVLPSPPTIIDKTKPGNLATHADEASPASTFTIYGRNISDGILLTAPAGYEVSADNVTFTKTIIVGPMSPGYVDNVLETLVYVRLAEGNAVGINNGNILLTSPQAPDVNVPVTGTIVEPISNIKIGVLTGRIAFCAGNPSASPAIEQFKVNGTRLTGDIILTAPANFEISISPLSGYGTTLTLKNTTGTISNVEIYVRSAAGALGDIIGDITLNSPGADRLVTVTGSVFPTPTADKIADVTIQGGITTTTIKFTGTGNTYDWINDNTAIGLSGNGSGNIAPFRAVNDGFADAVANVTVIPKNAALAYVPDQTTNRVSVINTGSGQIVGSIPVDKNPYAVTVSQDASRAFVANQGNGGSISVINTITSTVINTLTSGPNPSGLAASPDGGMLYVANGTAGTVTVINLNNGLGVANITVGKNPQAIVISPDGSRVYTANQGDNTVSVINTSTLQLQTTNIVVGAGPQSVTISRDGNLIYVANYNGQSISVIDAATNTVTGTIALKNKPYCIAITPDGKTLYVTNSGANSLSVINLTNNTVITTVPTDTSPEALSVSPDGKLVYVANFGANDIWVFDTATNKVVKVVGLLGAPVAFGNFIAAGTGCPGNPVTFKIIVKPGVPHILVSGALTALTTVYGIPSASASFNASAIDINANVLVTPPAGFEVSLDNITFSKTVTLHTTSTTIPSTPVYVRLSATAPANSYDGNIILSSSSVPSAAEPIITSTVTPAPLTVIADDKQRTVGKPDPVFTATYKGFVNNETAKQLITSPVFTTTALVSSPEGKYPIMVSGAVSPNYTFTYVDGVLTIKRSQNIFIPNAFTPNGDGINDTWLIKDLDDYPTATVSIFNRSGQTLFYFKTYAQAWDGTYNGKNLPTGVYYYVIDLHTGDKPLSGYVTIIR